MSVDPDHTVFEPNELQDAVEDAKDEAIIENAAEPEGSTFLDDDTQTFEEEQRARKSPRVPKADRLRATQAEWARLVPLGNEIFQAARHSHYAHNAEAIDAAHKSYWFSTAAAVLAAISGASLLVRITDWPALANDKVAVQVIQGAVALGAACLSAVQTKLNLSKSADMHRRAAVEYGAILRRMKIMFRLPLRERDGPREFFDCVQRDLHALAGHSPEISSAIWASTEERLLKDPSHLMGDEIDIASDSSPQAR